MAKDGDGGGSGEKSELGEKKEPAKDSGSGDKKPVPRTEPRSQPALPTTQPGA